MRGKPPAIQASSLPRDVTRLPSSVSVPEYRPATMMRSALGKSTALILAPSGAVLMRSTPRNAPEPSSRTTHRVESHQKQAPTQRIPDGYTKNGRIPIGDAADDCVSATGHRDDATSLVPTGACACRPGHGTVRSKSCRKYIRSTGVRQCRCTERQRPLEAAGERDIPGGIDSDAADE